ncbi:MAG: carboxylating nicotinate-nucleotide diphosphorylase [Endomicrobia bacterium]|nr:carboxylating nicotinate-nucleotide diphosphorylase [Endomicrobiia bacterium]MCX7940543.1 carboxylating nicotinate-nucleotide diphosphorylase [Endomicrobiia bacterium]MDW8056028.1 carboxylating nicotinate-nucleotide diphosphorylase [Elusimicrobiota bacterium]
MKFKLDHKKISSIVKIALEEDIGDGDITTENIIPPTLKVEAKIVAKESGIVCGLPIAKEVFKKLDRNCIWRAKVSDGDKVKPGKEVARIYGLARAILTGERVALNFLQHLSGIATATNRLVKIVKNKFPIYDTRKTHPGLRYLERYAVVCGGGKNHRFQLDDMVLVKDNHIKVCEYKNLPIEEILKKMKQRLEYTTDVEIECCNARELKLALKIKPDIIMLDNMSYKKLKKAIKLIRQNLAKTKIEISGRIDEDKLRKLRRLDIDYVSIGRITHSTKDIDFSLEIVK